jgi:hypothetical protein
VVHLLLQVFHSSVSQEEAGWKESLYRMYATGSANMRVAVYGAKHDAAPYEELLRKFCAVQELVSELLLGCSGACNVCDFCIAAATGYNIPLQ